jgi:hypothetical protein
MYKMSARKPEGNRPFGRSRRRWKERIRTVLREVGWDGVDWIYLARDRDQEQVPVHTVMYFRILYKAGNLVI